MVSDREDEGAPGSAPLEAAHRPQELRQVLILLLASSSVTCRFSFS